MNDKILRKDALEAIRKLPYTTNAYGMGVEAVQIDDALNAVEEIAAVAGRDEAPSGHLPRRFFDHASLLRKMDKIANTTQTSEPTAKLLDMAGNEIIKLSWQVRDTCSRAEKAEAALAEAKKHLTDLVNANNSGNLKMNSPEIGGDYDVPPHPWHEEWLDTVEFYLAKAERDEAEATTDWTPEIVSWLRAGDAKTLPRDPVDGNYRTIIMPIDLRALAWAIERGEHLKGTDDG